MRPVDYWLCCSLATWVTMAYLNGQPPVRERFSWRLMVLFSLWWPSFIAAVIRAAVREEIEKR